MPTVVQIGAGAIGRGFLGQLWTEAGYDVVFVDTDESLVAQLDHRGSYPLRLVSNDGEQNLTIAPIRAVSARDTEAVAREIAACAFMATAVGTRVVAAIGRDLIAPGLLARANQGSGPLNVILAENDTMVRNDLREAVATRLGPMAATVASSPLFQVAQTVVERMVPIVAPAPDDDPLLVRAEPYRHLPVNLSQWLGDPAPLYAITGIEPASGEAGNDRFGAFEKRKLFLHNGGHAVLAYHGYQRGYTRFEQCVDDAELLAELHGFWQEVIRAFTHSLPGDPEFFTGAELLGFTNELLERFRNRLLGDTVARVARDPARKLGYQERLVGTARFCWEHGVSPEFTVRAIAAALRYDAPDDSGAQEIQRAIQEGGIDLAIDRFTGIPTDSPLREMLLRYF